MSSKNQGNKSVLNQTSVTQRPADLTPEKVEELFNQAKKAREQVTTIPVSVNEAIKASASAKKVVSDYPIIPALSISKKQVAHMIEESPESVKIAIADDRLTLKISDALEMRATNNKSLKAYTFVINRDTFNALCDSFKQTTKRESTGSGSAKGSSKSKIAFCDSISTDSDPITRYIAADKREMIVTGDKISVSYEGVKVEAFYDGKAKEGVITVRKGETSFNLPIITGTHETKTTKRDGIDVPRETFYVAFKNAAGEVITTTKNAMGVKLVVKDIAEHIADVISAA